MKTAFQMPRVLAEPQRRRIYESAVRILPETPLTADGADDFNQARSDFGCRVNNGKVYSPKAVIDTLSDRIRVQKQAADPAPPSPLSDSLRPNVSGQGSLITYTEDDHLRPATTDDLAALARFLDRRPCRAGAFRKSLPERPGAAQRNATAVNDSVAMILSH